jgi:hypothetical protein
MGFADRSQDFFSLNEKFSKSHGNYFVLSDFCVFVVIKNFVANFYSMQITRFFRDHFLQREQLPGFHFPSYRSRLCL